MSPLFDLYEALREINPSPHLYLLGYGDRTVGGTSPEMVVPELTPEIRDIHQTAKEATEVF